MFGQYVLPGWMFVVTLVFVWVIDLDKCNVISYDKKEAVDQELTSGKQK